MNPYRSLLTALIVVCFNPCIRADVFEFAMNPVVARAANRVTIPFTSKDYCDATIAIECEQRRIIRHLASGVLGKNAPVEPAPPIWWNAAAGFRAGRQR